MAFIKVTKDPCSTLKGKYHAIFSVNSNGHASLRLLQKGIDWLKKQKIQLAAGEKLELYNDDTTGELAIKKSPDGKFILIATSVTTLMITANELKKTTNNHTKFMMREADEYDFVLTPYP
ncbi:MAG TPA: hypothetical protein QF753_17140 [Victivallales bacterium]|nr:hypothetical protein [Victivallales bacterium]